MNSERNMNGINRQKTDSEDRLVDLALGEMLGGDSPGDLTDRIMAATRQGAVERKEQPRNQVWISWLVGLAALLVISTILWPAIDGAVGPRAGQRDMVELGAAPADSPTSWREAGSKVNGVSKDESRFDEARGFGIRSDSGSDEVAFDIETEGVEQPQNLFRRVDAVKAKPPVLNESAPADVRLSSSSPESESFDSSVDGETGQPRSENYTVIRDGERAELYTLDVTEQREREESYSVMDTESRQRSQSHTIQLPEKRPGTAEADDQIRKFSFYMRSKAGPNELRFGKVQAPPPSTPSEAEWKKLGERRTKYGLVDLSQPASGETTVTIDGRKLNAKVVTEQKSRSVNDTAMRPETRTRAVPVTTVVDGKEVTELQTQDYTVMVPMTEALPETFYRSNVLKFFDEEGKEVAVDASQRARFEEQLGEQLGVDRLASVESPSGDRYEPIYENSFITAKGYDAVSTFSIDVDTAAYSNMRQFLNSGQMPPPNAIRLEELVNYFSYDYAGPADDDKHPFASHVEVASCPWNTDQRLVRVGIKGRAIETEKRPRSNIVFLLDVSGSMSDANKLPLVIDGLSHMTYQLGENDNVAIVVYAGASGLVLESTRGDKKGEILDALARLSAGGSTAGGAGINLAYKTATENFIKGGVNRVILCTDGDFNVGTTDTEALKELATQQAKDTGVFLTVLGYGRGNLNDEMMETISNCGNGNYFYIDNLREARRVMVEQLSGTLTTIAKDVKIQIEFNPANVASYRLLGYENRMLERQDFDDDTKDAGEIGAGHTVTALYEIVPAGVVAKEEPRRGDDQPLKYQPTTKAAEKSMKYQSVEATQDQVGDAKSNSDLIESEKSPFGDELLTLRLRYKPPTGDVSTKIEVAVRDAPQAFADASEDFRFASSVAGFGMLLRNSQHRGQATFESIREMAMNSMGRDPQGYRAEFVDLVGKAKGLDR